MNEWIGKRIRALELAITVTRAEIAEANGLRKQVLKH